VAVLEDEDLLRGEGLWGLDHLERDEESKSISIEREGQLNCETAVQPAGLKELLKLSDSKCHASGQTTGRSYATKKWQISAMPEIEGFVHRSRSID
jgi:hypothetical protein